MVRLRVATFNGNFDETAAGQEPSLAQRIIAAGSAPPVPPPTPADRSAGVVVPGRVRYCRTRWSIRVGNWVTSGRLPG